MRSCIPDDAVQSSVAWMARELYFDQRIAVLETCLTLLQLRLRNDSIVVEATDALFKANWIPNLSNLVMLYTKRIQELLPAEQHLWRYQVALQACWRERQLAVECLFYASYHVQMTASEVANLVDLLRELSNGLPVLNPYRDVPNPFEKDDTPWGTAQPIEKDSLEWKNELVTTAWKTGLPQLLRCCSTLVMTLVSALGDRCIIARP